MSAKCSAFCSAYYMPFNSALITTDKAANDTTKFEAIKTAFSTAIAAAIVPTFEPTFDAT